MADIAVIILTYNEAIHLERALRCVRAFAAEIFVVDSYSTDATVRIAKENGAVVLQNRFINHAKQFQWAIDNAPINSNWVMRLDADEVIGRDLADALSLKLNSLPEHITGINISRRHFFLGRWIRYGGRYPLLLLRIWRRGLARVEDRWMDEHIVLERGVALNLDGEFADWNLKDLGHFITKHSEYAAREAIDVLYDRYGWQPRRKSLSKETTSRQAAIKRLVKEKIFNRMPFWLGAVAYFLFRYIGQRGFLDGVEGLIYHTLQGFWYRFLVGARIFEYERVLGEIEGVDEKRKALSHLTGREI